MSLRRTPLALGQNIKPKPQTQDYTTHRTGPLTKVGHRIVTMPLGTDCSKWNDSGSPADQ